MKFTASALLLASAFGASAHPSGHHGHLHRSVDKRGHFFAAVKPEPTTTSAPAPVTTSSVAPPPPPPSSTSSAAPAPSATGSLENNNESSGSSSGSAPAFCGGNYKRHIPDVSKRATLADIAYVGNLGSAGNYGCNIMEVDAEHAESYKHLMTFDNVSGKDQQCVCFLKIGEDGGINGFFNGNQAIDFTIPSGGSSYIVADDDTQGGCACGHGTVPLTSWGEFASTWLEFDMASKVNNGWSGADASCLVSSALGLDIPGLQVCGHDTCSTINPGGSGTNAYLKGMEDEDGVGLNIAPGDVRLNIKVGYQG